MKPHDVDVVIDKATRNSVNGNSVYPGIIVHFQTDGRNGLSYTLAAIISCTAGSHPGDYPDGRTNPLPVPGSEDNEQGTVHLTVFSPGGFGSTAKVPDGQTFYRSQEDGAFPGSSELVPGSGTYVELNVPYDPKGAPGTWRFMPGHW